jgi:hypothetical protein
MLLANQINPYPDDTAVNYASVHFALVDFGFPTPVTASAH